MQEGKYTTSPDWADIQPIPLDDGSEDGQGATPLAVIAYKPEYLEATSYLRAVMAINEMSERVLQLTEDVIMMNPAHYTVWCVQLHLEEDDLNGWMLNLQWAGCIEQKFCSRWTKI
jgi:protein farnesyltransferase/geranylgeranyltransferase type-1 subunit alpha